MGKQLTIFDALNEYKDTPPSVPFVDEVEIFNAKNNKLDEFDDSLKNILELVNHISLSKASERAEKEIIEKALKDFSQEQFVEILFVTAILAGMGNMLGSADLVETD